jgi:hypothetical protein
MHYRPHRLLPHLRRSDLVNSDPTGDPRLKAGGLDLEAGDQLLRSFEAPGSTPPCKDCLLVLGKRLDFFVVSRSTSSSILNS